MSLALPSLGYIETFTPDYLTSSAKFYLMRNEGITYTCRRVDWVEVTCEDELLMTF